MKPQVCESCNRVAFPPRALCPRCGGSSWHDVAFADGDVVEVTEIAGTPLATIRSDDDIHVIARLDAATAPGDRVTLELVDGSIVASQVTTR